MTVCLSDPRPAYCSACHNSPDSRFVDFEAAFDAGAVVDNESQAVIAGSDDLHLCEACVRDAMEKLELKPELHARQLNEIRRLEIAVEYWRDKAQSTASLLDRTVREAPKDVPQPIKRGPGRPRKVAV